jgi:hypothetical protein
MQPLTFATCAVALAVATHGNVGPSAARVVEGPSSTQHAHVGAAPALTKGAAYSISHNAVDGSVVRWDPCRPIHYRINLSNAPKTAVRDVKGALGRIAKATGLSFTYDGTTTSIPQSDWGDGASDDALPLTIAWARPGTGAGRSDALTGGAVGVGGYRTQGRTADGRTWAFRIETGFVVIDAGRTKGFKAGFAARPSMGSLLMHEIGHAVGLNHSENLREIMYPTLARGLPATWGPGDLAGLRTVGAKGGCISDPVMPAPAVVVPVVVPAVPDLGLTP